MASSSSSQKQNKELNAFLGIQPAGKRRKVSESSRVYDVFINHRGPDVKLTLAAQLYNSLKESNIWPFLDSEEKELGNSFPSTIETAIRSAKVHIAIFSPRYAESPWCLAELVLMLQSTAKIIPLFYQVKPSDLGHIESGVYAEAFIKYKEKGRYLEQVNAWKEALGSLSLIAGEEFNSECDCQTTVTTQILAAVQKEVQRKTCLHVVEYPVGLNSLVKDFNMRCLDELVQDFEDQCWQEKGTYKTQVVGIFGMGGAGKTTLAKELFNRKKSNYTTASFLFDVREASVKSDLTSLQSSLFKDLFDKEISFRRKEEGTSYLKDHLRRAPPLSSLIVVDDIDHVEQLNALAVKDILEISDNSLVIVTTRDAGVLISAGITVGYNLKGMGRSYARELFCCHAFDRARPRNGYEALVDSFVDVCGGLPLSLQVLGRHVHGRDHRFWELELIKAQKMLPQDVKQRLRISFDALDNEEKQVFMDIACLFLGKQTSMIESVMEGRGWSVRHAMERLKEKCLLEKEVYSVEVGGFVLRMHDHVRDLGREMADELSPPHRLWRPQDLKSSEKMGFKTIVGKTNIRCFHSFFDKSMGSRVTFIFLGQPDAFSETSASLLWLQMDDFSKEPSIPGWIPLQNLQFLKINSGGLKMLWENHTQAPSQLKDLQICHCSALEELRLEHLSFLEKIDIQNCRYLRSVSGISNLASLVKLRISGCKKLVFENLTLNGMKRLESIIIVGGVNLKLFRLDSCPKLETIGFDYNELVELSIRHCPELNDMPNFISPSCLERIIIDGCGKLEYLQLSDCKKLKNVSVDITDLFITDCPELEGLPSFASLKRLDNDSCEKLRKITLQTTLISQSVKRYRGLKRAPGISDLGKLTIKEGPKVELSTLARLRYLQMVEIGSCEKPQKISGIEELHVSEWMRLCYCSNAVIRNYIHGLKSVPSKGLDMIVRAVNGAESSLNKSLFWDANIGVDGVIEIGTEENDTKWSELNPCDAIPIDGVTEIGPYENDPKWSELSAVILCFVVVIDSITSTMDTTSTMDIIRSFYKYGLRYKVREGEWIITMVECEQRYIYLKEVIDDLRGYKTLKKGFWVEVKKGEEWKCLNVLRIIVDKLY